MVTTTVGFKLPMINVVYHHPFTLFIEHISLMSIALSSPTLIYHNISPTIFINHGVPSLTYSYIYPREDARFVGMGEGYFQIFGKFQNLPPPLPTLSSAHTIEKDQT